MLPVKQSDLHFTALIFVTKMKVMWSVVTEQF